MKYLISALLFLSLNYLATSQNNYARLVNPFIGTGGTGHTFPGATSPFGMVQLSPDTRNDDSWEGCSGYYYADSKILGFSHTHLSGTGCSDYGDLLIMPFTFSDFYDAQRVAISDINHHKEKAYAGFYEITLSNNVQVKLTTTTRTGIHSYTYPSNEKLILLDLKHRDELLDFNIEIPNDSTILGHRKSKAWAQDQDFFFAIRLSTPISKIRSNSGEIITSQFPYFDQINHPVIVLEFGPNTPKNIILRVGISQVDKNGALLNLNTEAKHNNFDLYLQKNEDVWNKQLSKIEFEGPNPTKDTIFYTALYHCMIAPNTASDVDGRYRGMDRKIHSAKFYTHYSVFSLWDTYRALHPLFNIIERERSADFILTILNMYKEGGKLPVWELAGNETNCMIGYHSASLLADAVAKNIPVPLELACEAVESSANQIEFGVKTYATQGYLQVEDEHESVSKTVEYSYDDYCIAKLFEAKGDKEKAEYYYNRSRNFFNLMDPETGLIRPRSNGGFIYNFDPYRVDNNYTEANAWQYSYSFAHQLELFKSLNIDPLEKQLDKIFNAETQIKGRQQADMTGFIGQYVQGNEPSHHIAYLYMYTLSPYKTQNYLTEIMETMFSTKPDGLPGNEDCGQMSAWYVFTALGFYPVIPGENYYIYGKPFFRKATIHQNNGISTTLKFINPDKPYIEKINTNFAYNNNKGFYHDLFRNTDSIVFFGSDNKPSLIYNEKHIFKGGVPDQISAINWLPVPSIESPSQTFKDSTIVSIKSFPECKIYYSINSNNLKDFKPYTKPFTIKTDAIIYAYAMYYEYTKSEIVSKKLQEYKNKDLQVILETKPVSSYFPNNNPDELIDGLLGDADWKKGNWFGFQGEDVYILVKGNERKNATCFARVLQEERSWIFLPKAVEFEFYLKDKKVESKVIPLERLKAEAIVVEVQAQCKKKFDSFKVILRYPGTIPAPHPGAGHKSIQFIDDIGFK